MRTPRLALAQYVSWTYIALAGLGAAGTSADRSHAPISSSHSTSNTSSTSSHSTSNKADLPSLISSSSFLSATSTSAVHSPLENARVGDDSTTLSSSSSSTSSSSLSLTVSKTSQSTSQPASQSTISIGGLTTLSSSSSLPSPSLATQGGDNGAHLEDHVPENALDGVGHVNISDAKISSPPKSLDQIVGTHPSTTGAPVKTFDRLVPQAAHGTGDTTNGFLNSQLSSPIRDASNKSRATTAATLNMSSHSTSAQFSSNSSHGCNAYGPLCQTGSTVIDVTRRNTIAITTIACSDYVSANAQTVRSDTEAHSSWMASFGRSHQCTTYANIINGLASSSDLEVLSSCRGDGYELGATALPTSGFLPPGVTMPFGDNETVHCCGPCAIFIPKVELMYFPEDGDAPCSQSIKHPQPVVTAPPDPKHLKTSLFVSDGFTYTSPSLYFKIKGTASFKDACGQLGTKVVSSTVPVAQGDMWTVSFDVPVGGLLPTGEEASRLRIIAPLNTRDLACPTWGVTGPIPSDGPKEGVRIGPPFFPLLAAPQELLKVDRAWSKCIDNHWPLRFGIFDPPRALTANSVMVGSTITAAPEAQSPTPDAISGSTAPPQPLPAQTPATAIPQATGASSSPGSDSQSDPASGAVIDDPGQDDSSSTPNEGDVTPAAGLSSNKDSDPTGNSGSESSSGLGNGADSANGLGSGYSVGSENEPDSSNSSSSGISPGSTSSSGSGNSPGAENSPDSGNSSGSKGSTSDPADSNTESEGSTPAMACSICGSEDSNIDSGDNDSGSKGGGDSSQGSFVGAQGSSPGIIGGSSIGSGALPESTLTSYPVAATLHMMTIGGLTYAEDASSHFILGPNQTLSPGHSVTVSGGPAVVLASDCAYAVIDSTTQQLALVTAGAVAGSIPVIALTPGSALPSEIGRSTDTSQQKATATFTAHGYAITASPVNDTNAFVLEGNGGTFATLTAGGSFTVMGNEVVSMGTDGVLNVDGSAVASMPSQTSSTMGVGAAIATAFNMGTTMGSGNGNAAAGGGQAFSGGGGRVRVPWWEVCVGGLVARLLLLV